MLVNVATVAEALEVTPRRVQQLADEGWIPREKRGQYDLGACLEGYARYLAEVEGRQGPAVALNAARARKVAADAALIEMEAAVEAGELREREEIERDFGKRLGLFRARFLQIAHRLSVLMPHAQGREQREAWIRESLEEAVGVLDGPADPEG